MPAPAPACPAPTPASPAGASATYEAEHRRARERGVNPILYWLVRAVFQPFFHLYFRLSRIGREHIPTDGPVIFASNHRSFLDPFVIATLIRRPMYYVAKRELFRHRLQGWFLNSLGAFPVDRGSSDAEMIATAKAILARGDCVLIFPEGTRIRPGALGTPRRGVGRLALESGAPVVPLAVIGTEDVRRGWRIRPHKVRIRVGRALTFPRVQRTSPALAQAVTDRVWPCVMLQWEWLGGVVPMRRAAVIGSGARAAALTELLARAGLDLDARSGAATATGPPLADCDLVCLAGAAAELGSMLAAHGEAISPHATVLVHVDGLVAPLGTLPVTYVAERVCARVVACLGGPGHAGDALRGGAVPVVAATDPGVARELAEMLRRAGLPAEHSSATLAALVEGCLEPEQWTRQLLRQTAGQRAA